MWFPLVGIPRLVEQGMEAYREVFCRAPGFDSVSRYITGLLLSANKTLEGIHAQQVWPEGEGRSRRSMHTAVFEAPWDSEGLLPCHREVVSAYHRGRGLEVIGLDWTLIHHDRGPQIYVTPRNGEEKTYWVFSKTVRLKRYGRKRLVLVHEQEALSDAPRFLLTDALHWEAKRVIRVWSYRWPVEIFHEAGKQAVGLESSQVRKEEAVKRHFRLSCVAQSLLQGIPAGGQSSERFKWVDDAQSTLGQKHYTLAREALGQVLQLAESMFAQGQSREQVLERLMPA